MSETIKLVSSAGTIRFGRFIEENRGYNIYGCFHKGKMVFLAQKESGLHKGKIISGPFTSKKHSAVSLATVCLEAIDKVRDISIRDQFKTQTI